MKHTNMLSVILLATAVIAGPLGCSDDETSKNTTTSSSSSSSASGSGGGTTDTSSSSGAGGDNAGGAGGTGGDNAGGATGTGGAGGGATGTGGAGGATSSASGSGGSGGGDEGTVPAGCTAVTLGDLEYAGGNIIFSAETTPDVGFFQLHVIPNSAGKFLTGTTTLGTGVNDNRSTCDRCVLIAELSGAKRNYFATAGTLKIDAIDATTNNTVTAKLTGAKLEEVTIDKTTQVSTPVVGGACYYITSADLVIAAP